jgi:hypothetical protein
VRATWNSMLQETKRNARSSVTTVCLKKNDSCCDYCGRLGKSFCAGYLCIYI